MEDRPVNPEEGVFERFPEEIEQASDDFTKQLRMFKTLVGNSSKRTLERVLNAVAEFPLGEDQPKLKNDEERYLFVLFQEMTENKSKVLTHFISEQLQTKGENNVNKEG